MHWVWAGSFHSSTSGSPPGTPDHRWDSGVQNAGFTFDHQFTGAGTFHYYCSIHFSFGMVGTITVAPARTPTPRVWVANHGTNAVSEFGAGATGNAGPIATLAGSSTGLSGPFGLALSAPGQLAVASGTANALSVFAPGASGNASPQTKIAGASTGLAAPDGVALDSHGRAFVAEHATNAITEYAAGASGNQAPLATIAGAATGLSGPTGVAVDALGHVFATNTTGNSVTEYAPGASGNSSPIAKIQGASTGLNAPAGMAIGAGGKLLVANHGSVGNRSVSVTEYAHGATGNIAPVATIAGAATSLSGPWGVLSDGLGDLLVANSSANSVTEYAPGATGNASPFATLKGASTALNVPTFIALVTPAIVTRPASGVTGSSATLHGAVTPNGSDTHYFFQYGTTTAYGKLTPIGDAGAGSAAVAVAATVSSLTAGTTYHYRLVASSIAGQQLGGDATFTTP